MPWKEIQDQFSGGISGRLCFGKNMWLEGDYPANEFTQIAVYLMELRDSEQISREIFCKIAYVNAAAILSPKLCNITFIPGNRTEKKNNAAMKSRSGQATA